MFESVFERIGKGVSKNSGKIIVIWIVLIVLMGYGALLVFSHTSFNITNGFGSSKTMSGNATSEVSKYFNPSAARRSTDTSELIIVSQNITTTTSQGMNALISFQSEMNRYLKTTKNYTGTENIVVTERDTLQNYTDGILKLISVNYKITKNMNELESGINKTTPIFLVPEEIYFVSLNNAYIHGKNVTESESIAYNKVIGELPTNSPVFNLQKTYTNLFSSYVNSTLKSNNVNQLNDIIQFGSEFSLKDSAFNASLSSYNLYPIGQFIISYQNLTRYVSSPSSENVNLSVQLFKEESGSSFSSIKTLIVSTDNTSIIQFATLAYNLSQPATILQLDSISNLLSLRSTLKDFAGNPLFRGILW